MTEDSHCSEEPVRYVLEMNQGWFAKKNIKEGTQARRRAVRDQALKRRPHMKKPTRRSAFFWAKPPAQPKFLAAKSQFTSLARKVSTNLGRRLR